MEPESYSFVNLREIIDAKIARRGELLAAADAIQKELLGNKATCERCSLCRGAARPAKHIVIAAHGQRALYFPRSTSAPSRSGGVGLPATATT